MSLLAEFELAARALVLGPTLEAHPTLEVDLERQFALDPERPVSFCWLRGVAHDRLAAALERDETIAAYDCLERGDGRGLYRLERSATGVCTYEWWMAVGGELLDAGASDGTWAVTMRFPDRRDFASYHEKLEAAGVEFDLTRLANGYDDAGEGALTPCQREAIVAAYESGFFDVPRGTTLEGVAAELGISDQALSERLRRGHARLIEGNVR